MFHLYMSSAFSTSAYNFEHGGVVTMLVEAHGETGKISATRIRKALREGSLIAEDLCEDAVPVIEEIMKNKTEEEI